MNQSKWRNKLNLFYWKAHTMMFIQSTRKQWNLLTSISQIKKGTTCLTKGVRGVLNGYTKEGFGPNWFCLPPIL